MSWIQLVAVTVGAGLWVWPKLEGWLTRVRERLRQLGTGNGGAKGGTVELVELWQAYYTQAAEHGCPELVAGLEALFPHNLHPKEPRP